MNTRSAEHSKPWLAAAGSVASSGTGKPLLLLCAGLALLTLYRGWVLAGSDLSLYFDEAYYWVWSNSPAYGYFSKPPMIAWLIGLTTFACGEGEACIRSAALLSFPLTVILVYLLGARLFDRRVGLWSALLFATLPVVSFYSRIMTTDPLLMLFWALALYCFVRALQGDRLGDWLLAGFAFGAGLLSKYTMGFFLVSVVVYCAWTPRHRGLWRNPKAWAGLALAVALLMPNLVWNGLHGYASFRHTAEIAHWNGSLFHPGRCLEFLGGQFLLIGPVLGLALTALLIRFGRGLCSDEGLRLTLAFTLPMLLVYALQALLARANLNWAAAVYVPGSLLAAACLLRFRWRRSLVVSVAANLALGLGIYHYVELAQALGIPLTRKTDIYSDMRGWPRLAAEVGAVLARHPGAGLLCDNRRVMAELIYYLRPHPLDAAIYNPSGRISDHFRLTADVGGSRRDRFLFVTAGTDPAILKASFREVVDVGTVETPVHSDLVLKYRVFLVKDFRGYGS